jgi:hypothetical protein
MLISGLPLGEFERITQQVSDALYAGNLTVHQDAHPMSGNRCRARVVPRDSHETGARRSWSGRRGPWACWHAYRDVLIVLFEQYPDARVTTALAHYRGRDGFSRDYPATGLRNVGSAVEPVTMPQLCDCPDDRRADYDARQQQLRDEGTERYGDILARLATYPEDVQRQAVAYAETTYMETMTRIQDVLEGMTDWEREITAEQYRKDNL